MLNNTSNDDDEWEDDEDSEEEAQTEEWKLGFVEEPVNRSLLQPKYFPSKVGGKPAWLHPDNLPTADQLVCGAQRHGKACKKPMAFVLQIYAPLDALERPGAFHRTLYLFCCRDGGCAGKAGSVKCFRAQLPRSNKFYAYDPPDYDAADENADDAQSDRVSESVDPSSCDSKSFDEAIALKQKGNDLYVAKNFEDAISMYHNAIELLNREGLILSQGNALCVLPKYRDEIAKIYGNRAECLLQMNRFAAALDDCRVARNLDPSFSKTLFRQGKAWLGIAAAGGGASYGAVQMARDALKQACSEGLDAARGLLEESKVKARNEYLLKELEIIIDNEELEEDSEDEAAVEHVKRLMKEYNTKETSEKEQGKGEDRGNSNGGKANGKDDEDMQQLSKSKTNIDPAFVRFKLRTEKNKAQCVRYWFSPKARPLWIMSKGQIEPADVPPCPLCKGPRQFEFQVTPPV